MMVIAQRWKVCGMKRNAASVVVAVVAGACDPRLHQHHACRVVACGVDQQLRSLQQVGDVVSRFQQRAARVEAEAVDGA